MVSALTDQLINNSLPQKEPPSPLLSRMENQFTRPRHFCVRILETDAHTVQNDVYRTAMNPNGATLEQRILLSVRQRQAITTATRLFTESNYTTSYRPNPILFSITFPIYDVLVCTKRARKTHQEED
jgi:hypothetical protein